MPIANGRCRHGSVVAIELDPPVAGADRC